MSKYQGIFIRYDPYQRYKCITYTLIFVHRKRKKRLLQNQKF